MARYTKKGLKDPQYTNPNRYILNKISGSQYDVIPYKGAKGDTTAQPMNDANMADIEDGLVAIDEDLAFIEADYINAAEHALKQNISEPTLTTTSKEIPGAINELVSLKQNVTDNALTTTNKTVVGAINEVKSEGEYHDLLQDDAIAIVNNKINALPMNGSLKNIRTSTVGIPTTFTNIDMFNTKQTVANYQPSSLDYKGTGEPHIVLMKTIGDYVFDFSIEATHTNATDTTVTVEAWVDGVLYDTATRTLVGGTNQINGLTGFFQYSKGSDTVPSEIYFRFKASQGNTSANKAMINTNLQGNSATMSFTDTEHVTGINLNEPTYNGASTTFIINDLDASKLDKTGDTMTGPLSFGSVAATTPGDLSKHLQIYGNTYGINYYNQALNYVSQFNKHMFTNASAIVYAMIKDVIDEPKSLITKEYADANYLNLDGGEVTGSLTIPSNTSVRGEGTDTVSTSYVVFNKPDNITRVGFVGHGSSANYDVNLNSNLGNVVLVPGSGFTAKVGVDEILTTSNKYKQDWSLNDLGLDGSWIMGDILTNINRAYNSVTAVIGTSLGFTISQGFWVAPEGQHYEFSQSIRDSIINEYGYDIGTVFDFSIRFSEINGMTIPDDQISNYITIKTPTRSFTKQFQSDDWAASKWLDEKGAPHADIAFHVQGYMDTYQGFSLDTPMRDYISGVTFWVADYDAASSKWTSGDTNIRYVPRTRPKTTPIGASTGDGDSLFAGNHSMLSNTISSANPTTIDNIANMYFGVNYGNASVPYPNGITITGSLVDNNSDQVLAMVIVHYGPINWTNGTEQIAWGNVTSYTPSLLEGLTEPEIETPNIVPEIDNPDRIK